MQEEDRYEDRERARKKYEPARVRRLLIAEAPPRGLSRYFYFEDVKLHDSLFNETIHSIYHQEYPSISRKIEPQGLPAYRMPDTLELRRRKPEFLQLFMQDGFHLIDAVATPFPSDMSSRKRERKIQSSLSCLIDKIDELADKTTEIILIKDTVYSIRGELNERRYNVVNKRPIHFPGGSHQPQFRKEMGFALKSYFDEMKAAKRISDGPQE